MASVIVPNVDAPIAGPNGQTTRAWYAYFQGLRSAMGDAASQAAIDDILARLAELESDSPVDFQLLGPASVQVQGRVAGGFVQLLLMGDENSPGPTYYYGTDSAGAKGFFAVASAFEPGDGVTLTTDANTGVTTIEASGNGGVLPVVTGEVPPVLLYADDGSLIYAPASY